RAVRRQCGCGYHSGLPTPSRRSRHLGGSATGHARLLNGPASFQGEPIPSGVLTSGAQLRAPISPLLIDRLNEDAVPDAWNGGKTPAYALSVALSRQTGHSIPWTVLRNAIALLSSPDGWRLCLAAPPGPAMPPTHRP